MSGGRRLDQYNGGPLCGRDGCTNAAMFMPVIVFKAIGHEEAPDTIIPAVLLSIAFCTDHQADAEIDFGGKWANDLAAKLNIGLCASGKATVAFLRVEWKSVLENEASA